MPTPTATLLWKPWQRMFVLALFLILFVANYCYRFTNADFKHDLLNPPASNYWIVTPGGNGMVPLSLLYLCFSLFHSVLHESLYEPSARWCRCLPLPQCPWALWSHSPSLPPPCGQAHVCYSILASPPILSTSFLHVFSLCFLVSSILIVPQLGTRLRQRTCLLDLSRKTEPGPSSTISPSARLPMCLAEPSCSSRTWIVSLAWMYVLHVGEWVRRDEWGERVLLFILFITVVFV